MLFNQKLSGIWILLRPYDCDWESEYYQDHYNYNVIVNVS